MKKALLIIGGMVLGIAILFIVIFFITSITLDKLVCKSDEGNITIMYNDKTITGYTANGMSYDLDGQRVYAERIEIKSYIEEFRQWFSSNTTGSCKLKN